jgi:DNA-binding CsgD family transcriptional regulator/tetratricopeptide (TPR) repeat protein
MGIILHPMVRRGAADRSDAGIARQRFLEWLSDELAQTAPLVATKHSRAAFARMDRLAADISAGLDLLTVEPLRVATAIVHLCEYWSYAYQLHSQLRWTTKALELIDNSETIEAQLHLGASRAHELLLDLENADSQCSRALAMARHAGDHRSVATALAGKLSCAVTAGAADVREEEYQEAVEICRRYQFNDMLGNIFSIRAERVIYEGSPSEALELASQGVEAARSSENLIRQTWCLLVQSWAYTNLGDFAAAAQSQRSALMAAQQIDSRCALDLAVYMYEGDTLAASGRVQEGAERVRRVVIGLETIEVPLGLTETTRMLAEMLAELGEHAEARRQFKRSIELAVALDNVRGIWAGLVSVAMSSPEIRPALSRCGQILRSAAAAMPEVLAVLSLRARDRRSVVEAEISAMTGTTNSEPHLFTLEEYTTMIVQHLGDSEPAVRPHRLSIRELEVLRRLAIGETDGEIASALIIGTRTVNSHVSAILRKLGVQRRRQAAAWARVNLELAGPAPQPI